MTESDRRVQRTRELLQKALIELLGDGRYHTITVQDIVDRANIGRTTFYLHYNSKDDLLISCHEAKANEFHFAPIYSCSREELLSSETPPGMTAAYQHLADRRALLYPIFHGKDNHLIQQRIRDESEQKIEANLHVAFAETDSVIPLDMLAKYLAGAHFSLMLWWLEQRQPHPPETIAQAFHLLQRAALRDAFGLGVGE